MSFSYGSLYVAHARTIPVSAQYSAAHRRHGLASDTVGCGSRSRGFLINMCRGTARACGLVRAITIAARHISISNNADGMARTVLYEVALLVMALNCAMNERIPRTTGEYIVTNEARHCQYCNVWGTRALILKRRKNSFSMAPFFGRTVPDGKSTRKSNISAVWANTFFFTDRPAY